MAKKFGIQDLLPPTPRKFHEDKYQNKIWVQSMVNPVDEVKAAEYEARMKAKEEAIANMDKIITEVRPSYKKLLEKRENARRHGFKIYIYSNIRCT